MFKMYDYDHYGKLFLGLCSTKEVGAQSIKGKASRLVFVEDCEPYDYFTVHQWVDGFGNDDLVLFSAQSVEECEKYINNKTNNDGLCIIGQKFGQEFVTFYN